MPVPSSRTDLDTTAGNNSPTGSEAVFPNLDNYLRSAFAFIRQNYDDIQTQGAAIVARVPIGVIVLWSGSSASIPSGWSLCDGTNGTPDLRNRFVVGATSSYAVGATGGASSGTTSAAGGHNHGGNAGATTLTLDQIPAHTHSVPAGIQTPPHTYIAGGGDAFNSAFTSTTGSAGGGNSHTHTISSEVDHTHTFSNLPPYYALCYIMRTS